MRTYRDSITVQECSVHPLCFITPPVTTIILTAWLTLVLAPLVQWECSSWETSDYCDQSERCATNFHFLPYPNTTCDLWLVTSEYRGTVRQVSPAAAAPAPAQPCPAQPSPAQWVEPGIIGLGMKIWQLSSSASQRRFHQGTVTFGSGFKESAVVSLTVSRS